MSEIEEIQCPYCLKQIDKMPNPIEMVECGYCGENYTKSDILNLFFESENEIIKVGDKVVLSSIYEDRLINIVRETKTLLIDSNQNKYSKKDYSSYGSDRYGISHIRKASADDIKRIGMANKRKFVLYNIGEMDNELVEMIYPKLKKIIEENKKG